MTFEQVVGAGSVAAKSSSAATGSLATRRGLGVAVATLGRLVDAVASAQVSRWALSPPCGSSPASAASPAAAAASVAASDGAGVAGGVGGT